WYLLGGVRHAERLLKKWLACSRRAVQQGLTVICGNVNSPKTWAQSQGVLRQLGAAHSWHDQIGNQQMDGPVQPPANAEGVDAVFRGQDVIPLGAQKIGAYFTQTFLVFHEHDRFGSARKRQ